MTPRQMSIDRDEVATNWGARSFGCDLWVDPPGQVWEDYTHQTDEPVMVVEGELELEFLGRSIRPTVGEEVFIPAGACHTVRNIGSRTACWLFGYKRSAGVP